MNPDNNSTAEFDDFVASGDVEVGEKIEVEKEAPGETETKPTKRRAPRQAKPETEQLSFETGGESPGGDDDQGSAGEAEGEQEPPKKAKQPPSERIRELNKRLRETERGRDELEARFADLEKRLQAPNGNANSNGGAPAPDPTDADRYPLGHLDENYIEDKIAWRSQQEATRLADAALQRQQENERNASAETQQRALLEKVDSLAERGNDFSDTYYEDVVETGLRGDWDLTQTTFEAAHEADHGAQILHELALDPREASRVAKLSIPGQVKFVLERNSEIAAGKQGRTKPQAGAPPKNLARGATSRTQISPATDNLEDFEKAWKQDEARH